MLKGFLNFVVNPKELKLPSREQNWDGRVGHGICRKFEGSF